MPAMLGAGSWMQIAADGNKAVLRAFSKSPMRLCRQIALVLLAALLIAVPAAADADPMYWGALIKGDAYGLSGEAPTSTAVLDRFESDAGKQITIVNTGQSWASFDPATMDAAVDAGAIPLVTMPLGAGISLQEVAEGEQDAAIRSWARAAKAFEYPFLFRPWWESNGNWYSWGQSPYFAAAWQHFHDLVIAEGATNVTWAWVVNTIWEKDGDVQDDPTPYYPGDAYVDWVGVDAYNWGRNPLQPDGWVTAEESIQPTLEVLEEIAPGKPVCVCESASTEIGEGALEEDKATWIHEMLDEYLPSRPRIKAYVWFNWNVEQGGYGSGGGQWDWPIESSPEAEAAFREEIQSDTYLSILPPLMPLTKVPVPPSSSSPPASDSDPAPASDSDPAPQDSNQGQPPSEPRDSIGFGSLTPGARPGGSILTVAITDPGQLRFSGRGLQIRLLPLRRFARPPFSRWMEDAGELKLEVRAAGAKLRRLAAKGHAKLVLKVRFTPEVGTAQAATRLVGVTRPGS
jgi:Glycosyl hydrolase family 26